MRELLTVKYALEEMATGKTRAEVQKTVYWLTDSENLVKFLTKGSGKEHIQKEVLATLAKARKLRLDIVPIHLRREDPRIRVADAGSKNADSDDWSIDHESFQFLEETYGPFSVDLFADEGNARVKRFYSKFFSFNAEGVEAMCQDWSGENAWVSPPSQDVDRSHQEDQVAEAQRSLDRAGLEDREIPAFHHGQDGKA
jgi:hypothetical protein